MAQSRRPRPKQGKLAADPVLRDYLQTCLEKRWSPELYNGSAIGTLVERTTRFVMLLHLPGAHTADAVRDALVATIGILPAQIRRSLTWDQGKEMARHLQITTATDMPVFFCDPHSPWQRGSNENTNGLLRQYFPRAPT